MNKLIVICLALLLFGSLASATITLTIVFGEGIQHNIEEYTGMLGKPNPENIYFVDFDSNGTKDPTQADAVSIATKTGTIVFIEEEKTGDCIWYASINDASGTKIESTNLNGTSINESENIYWSVKPNNNNVERCSIRFDLNVQS